MAVNYGGGLSGAASGAALGSSFGPIGTGVGAIGGGLLGLFGGSDNKLKKLPTQTKQQQALQNAILGQAGQLGGQGGGYNDAISLLQQYLNPNSEAYANFEAPYRNEFEQQTIPGLAERFAGFGANSGALSSSGFGQAIGGAGAGLQAKLAGLKANMASQSIGQLLNQYNQLINTGLGKDQFAYGSQPGGGGVAGGFGASSAQSLPLLLAMMSQNQGAGQTNQSPLSAAYGNEFQQNTSGPYNLPTFMGR